MTNFLDDLQAPPEQPRDPNAVERPGLVLIDREPLTTEEFEKKHGGIKKIAPIIFEEEDGTETVFYPPSPEENR